MAKWNEGKIETVVNNNRMKCNLSNKAYYLWVDTVNTELRLLSNGQERKKNINKHIILLTLTHYKPSLVRKSTQKFWSIRCWFGRIEKKSAIWFAMMWWMLLRSISLFFFCWSPLCIFPVLWILWAGHWRYLTNQCAVEQRSGL